MKLLIEIDLDNAAMQDDGQPDRIEIKRVLENTGRAILYNYTDEIGVIRDLNGNTIGKWEIV